MQELNDYVLATTPDEKFVTLFLALLEAPTGRLRYANASHLAPLALAGPGCRGADAADQWWHGPGSLPRREL
jgi:hypothetical protein